MDSFLSLLLNGLVLFFVWMFILLTVARVAAPEALKRYVERLRNLF